MHIALVTENTILRLALEELLNNMSDVKKISSFHSIADLISLKSMKADILIISKHLYHRHTRQVCSYTQGATLTQLKTICLFGENDYIPCFPFRYINISKETPIIKSELEKIMEYSFLSSPFNFLLASSVKEPS